MDCENLANRFEEIEKGTREFLHFISTNSTGSQGAMKMMVATCRRLSDTAMKTMQARFVVNIWFLYCIRKTTKNSDIDMREWE